MNLNNIWAEVIIEELRRSGISDFCIAPGSRSAPLTIACSENNKISTHVHFDERGLAYFALGLAKSSGRPVVVITTSGTAVPNVLPAVAEAHLTHIPLVVLSADRPRELLDCGANQTIRQGEIFADFTCFHTTLAEPQERLSLKYVQTTASRLAQMALEYNLPVHLNCPFPEPLYPNQAQLNNPRILQELENFRKHTQALTQMPSPGHCQQTSYSCDDTIKSLLSQLRGGQKILIICGALASQDEARTLLKLSCRLQAIVLADAQSQLRLSPQVIAYGDLLLCCDAIIRQLLEAKVFLVVGGQFISKRFGQLLKLRSSSGSIIWLNHQGQLQDPFFAASCYLKLSINDLEHLTTDHTQLPADTLRWYRSIWHAQMQMSSWLENYPLFKEFNELAIIRYISAHLKGSLMLGNSLTPRIFNLCCATSANTHSRIYANRGASGIDGLIATAGGIGSFEKQPLTLILGDTSALYDLNSLALLRGLPVAVIILNNAGGNIFKMLPGAREHQALDQYFVLPHAYRFKEVATMFDLDYVEVNSLDSLAAAYGAFGRSAVVIECRIAPDQTVSLLKQFLAEAAKAAQNGIDSAF